MAACAAPLVGVLAERLFGFCGTGTVTGDRQRDLANAAALGNALLAFLLIPWCFTLLLYTGGRGWGWYQGAGFGCSELLLLE